MNGRSTPRTRQRAFGALAAIAGALAGCTPAASPSSAAPASPADAPGNAATPARTASAESAAGANAAPASQGVTFIEDDYPRALAEARRTKKPLFIDAWATWCHTCLSMRSYVFPDKALTPLSGSFVWLAIDTEKPESAAFLEKYPMRVWPTLWVVDAEREAPVLKWLGAATAPELAQLLEDAALAAAHGDAGGEAGAAFVRAKQASAAGKHDDALREYRAALATAPSGWKRRPQVSEALAFALQEAKEHAACVAHARAEIPKLPPGTSLSNVALSGLQCARAGGNLASATALAATVTRVAEDRAQPILADDRSSLFEELVGIREEAKDAAGAKALARTWAAFLEEQAARATSNEARAVFDAHRLLAYIAVGAPERALPMLMASERDFPSDYNPPARLARAYLELHRYDDALAAIDRALTRVYGGRELRLRATKADIQIAKGDSKGAVATLRDATARAAKIDLPPNYQRLRTELTKRLATLERTTDR